MATPKKPKLTPQWQILAGIEKDCGRRLGFQVLMLDRMSRDPRVRESNRAVMARLVRLLRDEQWKQAALLLLYVWTMEVAPRGAEE